MHVQDLPETDLLLAAEYAAHEGGVVAALESLGLSAPPLYHLDSTNPQAPRARMLNEEIASAMRASPTMNGVKAICFSNPTSPSAWTIRTATPSSSGVKRARSASALMVAKDWR